MNEYDNLCMNCMKPTSGETACPFCGFDNQALQTYPYLPPRTVLTDRYLVGRMLERTSDCVVYMGYDMSQKAPITLREFFPNGLTNRIAGSNFVILTPGKTREYQECLNNFLDLWRNLAKMRQLSAIVPVYDIFEENNTAYAVSEYMEHITLRDFLLRQPEGYIPWEKARILFMPVLSTMIALHNNGIIHRAISPTNLVICRKDNKLRLDNFSVWEANTQNSCLQFQDQPGYFALEQYENDYQQGPWTDIYGFTATLYRALVGNNPIDAQTRALNDKLMIPAKFAEQIPAYVINAMGNALQIYPNDRTRNVERLRAQLSAAPSETVGDTAQYEKVPVPRMEPAPQPPVYEEDGGYYDEDDRVRRDLDRIKKKQKSTMILAIIAAAIVIIGVAVGVYFAVKGNDSNVVPTTEETQMVTVPNFCIGYTEVEIRNDTNYNQNFQIEYEVGFSDTFAAGEIMDQSLPANTQTAKGTKITLTVSKGVETFLLQSFTGVQINEVKEKLKDTGFEVQTATKLNDGSHTEGTVYSQFPEGGSNYPKGTVVIFQVWGPPVTETETEPETESNTKTSFTLPTKKEE